MCNHHELYEITKNAAYIVMHEKRETGGLWLYEKKRETVAIREQEKITVKCSIIQYSNCILYICMKDESITVSREALKSRILRGT